MQKIMQKVTSVALAASMLFSMMSTTALAFADETGDSTSVSTDVTDAPAAEEADAKLRLSPLTTWRRVTYRVRSGDTLSSIARRWHITVKSIVQGNRLRSDRLHSGQRLWRMRRRLHPYRIYLLG